MLLRRTNIQKLDQQLYDVLIVGAGINGAVSAAALAARGARVAIIDKKDFGSGTSQESSNLAWGGIKYLENYEFSLVWDLCGSRNRLMRAYPSNVREIRFFTAIEPSFRWHPLFMYCGVWLYWFMGRGFTEIPRYLSRDTIQHDEPAINAPAMRGGVEYSDCYLIDNDARFVFSFVRLAINVGATVANYVELLEAKREKHDGENIWVCRVRDSIDGVEKVVRSKALINAAGPWLDAVNADNGIQTKHQHVFSKGIHLLVDRITPNDRVLTFFDETGRMFFVIPMGVRSVVGTTDTRVDSPNTHVTEEDRDFVLRNVNARLRLDKPLSKEDIIAERCGVRPLVVVNRPAEKTQNGQESQQKDWFQLSRKHVLDFDLDNCIVSMYGGKLTDCINVGEEICEIIEEMGRKNNNGLRLAPDDHRWYGEPDAQTREAFFRQAHLLRLDERREKESYELLSTRLWRRYGLRAFAMLEDIRADPTMDDVLIENAQYLRCELHHAAKSEMVTKLEDFLRRRSKIALVVPEDELKQASGVHEACRILFGDEAEKKYREYFAR